jgi:hypothetical protein
MEMGPLMACQMNVVRQRWKIYVEVIYVLVKKKASSNCSN